MRQARRRSDSPSRSARRNSSVCRRRGWPLPQAVAACAARARRRGSAWRQNTSNGRVFDTGGLNDERLVPIHKCMNLVDDIVLVVEDEPTVRSFCCAVLRRFGYRVLEAAGPIEALAKLHELLEPVTLVLTD